MPPGIAGGDLAGGPPERRRLATEDEASIQCGGALPPEPMPCGLCVELLFLDEDTLEYDEERRSSAKGLVASLQRQLGDAGSHLRRKSAFGSLVSRGAFVRVLGYEQISPRRQMPSMQLPFCSESTASWSRPGVVPREQLRRDQVEGSATAQVPKLRLRAAGPLALPADGFGAALAYLFSWMPGCGTPLCAEPTDTVRVCRMPEAAPFDSQASEAGLGGWPLSLPEVHVAFLHASELRKSASVEAPGDSPSALPLLGAEAAEFQRAAIELDEDELVILCPSLLKSASAGTPSTASTKVSDSWAPGRLVCHRAGLSRVRGLRTQELEQLQAPTPHVLDFECNSNSGLQFRLLLALPNAKVAARFREASQAPVQPATPTPRPCNGVRCELRINARLQLNSSRDFQNCAAVVRRGICEATHVSSDRVLVQRIWIETSGFDGQ